MEWLTRFVDFVLHLDRHLTDLAQQHGDWIYGILAAIIFSETGFVVTPFLPGDSLLFVAGALAGGGVLDAHLLFMLLSVAGIAGNTVNYHIGRWIGPKVFHFERSRWFNPEHLVRTHAFFERHGGKTLILSRFLPIFRTFAPFVAGVGAMTYLRFQIYNVTGAVLWVGTFIYGGYFFGNVPVIKQNLTAVIMSIIVLSVLPAGIEYLRHRRRRRAP